MDVQKHYDEKKDLYLRLAENVKKALQTLLESNKNSIHSISSRIKDFESYKEKIERKGYRNPAEQIEDFCGLRIICFYPEDLMIISQIIQHEFKVIESIDKTANLEPDRFGYRSNHFIIKLKNEWLNTPEYRGLENLKAEIQVRTILMHSWADIEHKLAYKKTEDVPLEFRRKLYQLSALLEIADAQFQELKNEKEKFKKTLITVKKGETQFDTSKPINIDSLQTYMDFVFPDKVKLSYGLSNLVKELNEYDIKFTDIEKYRKDSEQKLPEIEEEMKTTWAQMGAIRAILDLNSDTYWEKRKNSLEPHSNWKFVINKWRKILRE